MAFMNQERKAERAPAIKAVLKKYDMKGSISVQNYSSLVVTLKEGKLDLIGMADRSNREHAEFNGREYYPVSGHYQMNQYHDADKARRMGEEKIANFIDELTAAMYGADYFDESDAMTDYFHCSHYININVGKWNKDYKLVA